MCTWACIQDVHFTAAFQNWQSQSVKNENSFLWDSFNLDKETSFEDWNSTQGLLLKFLLLLSRVGFSCSLRLSMGKFKHPINTHGGNEGQDWGKKMGPTSSSFQKNGEQTKYQSNLLWSLVADWQRLIVT